MCHPTATATHLLDPLNSLLSLNLFLFILLYYNFSSPASVHIPMTPKSNWGNYVMRTRLAEISNPHGTAEERKTSKTPKNWSSRFMKKTAHPLYRALFEGTRHFFFSFAFWGVGHFSFILPLAFSSFSIWSVYLNPSLARQKSFIIVNDFRRLLMEK